MRKNTEDPHLKAIDKLLNNYFDKYDLPLKKLDKPEYNKINKYFFQHLYWFIVKKISSLVDRKFEIFYYRRF